MDPSQQQPNLFITYVDKEGPFLKVWGQSERNSSHYVEQFLLGASQQFELGVGKIPFDTLQVGTLVCAKYKDNKYYRARIVSIDYLNQSFVEVSFLDYGNKDIVPSGNIRGLQNFPTTFISIPPLATAFIFAEAHCPGGGEWKDEIFEIISKELRYREVQYHSLTQAAQYYLVKLFINNSDIGALFISKGLLQLISLPAQQAVLLSMSMQKKLPTGSAAPAVVPTEINTYKACSLEPMQEYAVYVSYVSEGPTDFSVQLKQSEQLIAKLMKEINEIDLRMLEDVPLPGTICLARCKDDGNICRAVVINEIDTQFKVFYVDFGNYEVQPFDCLYQISFKYVLPKVMAIRVALNGIEKSSVTKEMQLAFKKFVDNRLLHMKVLPSPKKSSITKCELWDPETNTSALDVIIRAARHAYPDPLVLNRGFTQPVKVSYVFSCNRFYVQLSSKENELADLMEELQISCQTSDPIYEIKVGLPCCALFEVDQLWYRSEIVEVVDKENIKVRYIDYGNEEVVPITQLKMVEGELLTVLRPQAIECCLNGYQNLDSDETRDALLEELILEQNFTMKVSEMLGRKALVELIDASQYNVASLLLDKIAASKSQVSPMLVQAGNTLEHRKSSDSSENYRSQKKTEREWVRNEVRNFDNSNEKPWRNDKDTRQNDINSNDGFRENVSWRQNNKGFDRSEKSDRNRETDQGNRNYRGDRPNINDRFNRNRDDKGNDRNYNRNNRHDGSQNAPSWSSPVNAAAPPTDNDWDGTTPSPVQNSFESRKPRDDNFGGRRKFDDRRDREDKGDKGGWNNRNDKGGGWSNNRDDKGGWNNREDKGGWNNKDDKGGWNNKDDKGGWNNRDDKGGWNNRDGFKRDGFKKDFRKPHTNKRDGSELSSSGSEKSFKKGPRTSSRNDYGGNKKFQNRSATNDSWSVSDVSTPIDAAPNNAKFDQLDVVGSEAAVVISWFHNPQHFYCQLQSGQPEFRTLMEEIQQYYKNRKPETSVVGAPIIGLFPEDNVLYRAQVLEVLGGQYKVFYIDFGNVSTITKVWPIEKKFMKMPAQAVCCGLAGIGPVGENWEDPSNFSNFFEKEYFMARFLEKDEIRAYIQLWDNQEEVSQLLIQANLAVPVGLQSDGEIQISFLLNQQFRVVLKSVNNLKDIIVALESGLALTCKAHNLEMASESHEDVLKGYLEKTLIVYVDNILENDLLDVTFYDNEGNKLNLVTPDEGAFDNVEPLCPLLIINSKIYGFVSHADETAVFIQPSEYADQVATLLEQMFEAYDSVVQEDSIIPEEGLVYAVHSTDGNWYRGKVESFDDEKATVYYVDYGNTENVAFSELRELKSDFYVPNILCLQVTVTSGSALSFLEKDVVTSICYGETGWEGALEECIQSVAEPENLEGPIEEPTAELSTVPLVQDLVLGEDIVNQIDETVDETVNADQVPAVEDIPQKGTPVLVSHIDSPTEFYVQFAESATALDALQQNLQVAAAEFPVLDSISVGVLCAAPYSVDHMWYRSEVLDADEDITTVRFVDFGNTDVINNMTTEIKTLPPELLSLALYATRCSLKLKSIDEEWSQQALELFESLANRENVTAEFIIQDEKTNIIELYSNRENVKDMLLEHHFAVPCEIGTESKTTCFFSHLNSPSEFWVQMENCVSELEWIAEQLSSAEQFPELEDTTPGTLCAALFPDDEMWYRARILSNTVAGIELLFIDYGNSCVSGSLRQLPEDLLVTPPLAQKCCLQKPEGILYWTKQAQDKFAELSAEGKTIFEIRKISTGETATVELLINGENVVPKILPVTQDGYVKNFKTLNDFCVEQNGELLPENVCLEPMPGMEWGEDSNKKFLKLYPDGTLFQVELIAEDCVRLYLNGADIRPQLDGVKAVNLNLTNSQGEKTETSVISEDHVVEYEAGGDVDAESSVEYNAQNETGTSQDESETATKLDSMIDETNSDHADSADKMEDEDNSQDSEIDSGHHSDRELPKDYVKVAESVDVNIAGSIYEKADEESEEQHLDVASFTNVDEEKVIVQTETRNGVVKVVNVPENVHHKADDETEEHHLDVERFTNVNEEKVIVQTEIQNYEVKVMNVPENLNQKADEETEEHLDIKSFRNVNENKVSARTETQNYEVKVVNVAENVDQKVDEETEKRDFDAESCTDEDEETEKVIVQTETRNGEVKVVNVPENVHHKADDETEEHLDVDSFTNVNEEKVIVQTGIQNDEVKVMNIPENLDQKADEETEERLDVKSFRNVNEEKVSARTETQTDVIKVVNIAENVGQKIDEQTEKRDFDAESCTDEDEEAEDVDLEADSCKNINVGDKASESAVKQNFPSESCKYVSEEAVRQTEPRNAVDEESNLDAETCTKFNENADGQIKMQTTEVEDVNMAKEIDEIAKEKIEKQVVTESSVNMIKKVEEQTKTQSAEVEEVNPLKVNLKKPLNSPEKGIAQSAEANSDKNAMDTQPLQQQLQTSEPHLPSSKNNSRCSSVDRSSSSMSHDERILPACLSRPHSPLPDQEPVQEKPISRPPSSLGGRFNNDDTIVPAGISRPHTPILDGSEVD